MRARNGIVACISTASIRLNASHKGIQRFYVNSYRADDVSSVRFSIPIPVTQDDLVAILYNEQTDRAARMIVGGFRGENAIAVREVSGVKTWMRDGDGCSSKAGSGCPA